jgi:hypothetical protein
MNFYGLLQGKPLTALPLTIMKETGNDQKNLISTYPVKNRDMGNIKVGTRMVLTGKKREGETKERTKNRINLEICCNYV